MSTEKKTTAAQEAQTPAEAVGTVAYCGPTVKGIAPQYTVFVDGLPEKLKEKVEQVPLLNALIVPLDKLAETRVKIDQEGTRENILYNKAADLMKYGGHDKWLFLMVLTKPRPRPAFPRRYRSIPAFGLLWGPPRSTCWPTLQQR